MGTGLTGSHRVGKTTLAKAYSEKYEISFVENSTSAIFRDMGFDPSVTYDFETRLTIQEEILRRMDANLANYAGTNFIADRTPIDLIMYTLADAVGDRVPAHCQERTRKYVQDCFEVTNKRFGSVFLIQPGIHLVQAEGKAAVNEAYIEHLNSLALGLTVDERLKSYHFYIPRHITDLDERVAALQNAVTRTVMRASAERMDIAQSYGSASIVTQ